jgi:hypothetical protein
VTEDEGAGKREDTPPFMAMSIPIPPITAEMERTTVERIQRFLVLIGWSV